MTEYTTEPLKAVGYNKTSHHYYCKRCGVYSGYKSHIENHVTMFDSYCEKNFKKAETT